MPSNTEPNIVRRLTVERRPGDYHPHRLIAELVDTSAILQPQAATLRVTPALSGKLTRLLFDFKLSGSQLTGRLNQDLDTPYGELWLVALLRRQFGQDDQACEALWGTGARLPSQLLGLYDGSGPAVRRLMPVVDYGSYGKCDPWIVPAYITSQLEATLATIGVNDVGWSRTGYLLSAADETAWEDPEFEAKVLYCLLRHLKWDADQFAVAYNSPATETVQA